MKSFIKKSLLIAVVFYSVKAEGQTWSWTGNPSTNPPTNFVGTTDLKDLYLKTNGTSAITILSSNQNVGIGITNPLKKLHVSGSTQFDVTASGLGNGRFYFNRPALTNYENLISFTTAGTSTYDWTFGTSNGSPDFILSGWTALRSLTILQSSGNVGIGNTPNPVTKLHVNGDLTFGSATSNRKWRFITQNWMDGGKMFLQPDKQDGSGNVDGNQGITIDPIYGYCDFGTQAGTTNVSIGDINTHNTAFTNGTSYIGFNAQRNMSNGNWASNGAANVNGGGIIWGNTDGSLLFSPQLKVAGGNSYADVDVKNRKTMEIRWDYTDGLGQVVIGAKTLTTGTNTNFRLSVDGKMVAKEIYVVNDNTWADYVFAKDYKLKSLNDVEEFIIENKHLPNVPSANEIATNGNNIGQTEKILLEKIEELTLYVIQQNKRIEELEKKGNKK